MRGGGGGGSGPAADTLNGTALTGAAISGGTITVKDKTGAECATATSGTDGKWSAPTTNCKGEPYLIKVVGKDVKGVPVTFFSAATAADVNKAGATSNQVNVSQLTDLIVKNLLKTDKPDAVTPAALVEAVTADNLQTTSQNTLKALVPASELGDFGKGDIRTMAITAGSGTGLDGLHDKVPAVEVTVANGIVNLLITVQGANGSNIFAVSVAVNAAPSVVPTPPATGTSPEEVMKTEITQMLSNWDAVYATAAPTTGAVAMSFSDACYLDDGQDQPSLLARWADATDSIHEGNKYRVGATRSNVSIVDMSFTTNASGTKTRHATVKYDITYTDGTKAKQAVNRLVFGDSAPWCASRALSNTGENRLAWRFLGNGRQVETNVNPVNVQFKKYSLANGSAIPTGDYRHNRLEFGIYDYRLKGYTYAVVTGQNLPASGLKFLMPNTLKTAPELQGKSGAFTNSNVFDGARICRYVIPAVAATTGVAATPAKDAWDANKADCTQYGAIGNYWSFGDTSLAALNVGTPYTFKLYKGDGWKTVNGHDGVTPAATYTDELPAVPYNATQFASTGFGSFGTTGTTTADLAAMFRVAGGTATANPVNVSGLPAGANAMARRSIWAYSNGKANSADANVSLKQINRTFPNNTDASVSGAIPGKMAAMSAVSYAEVGMSTVDRNGRSINTIYYFQ